LERLSEWPEKEKGEAGLASPVVKCNEVFYFPSWPMKRSVPVTIQRPATPAGAAIAIESSLSGPNTDIAHSKASTTPKIFFIFIYCPHI
jgi:hypothetical protein